MYQVEMSIIYCYYTVIMILLLCCIYYHVFPNTYPTLDMFLPLNFLFGYGRPHAEWLAGLEPFLPSS